MTGIGRYTLEIARRMSEFDEIQDMLYYDGVRVRNFIQKPSYRETTSVSFSKKIKNILGRFPFIVNAYKFTNKYMNSMNLSKLNGYVYHGTNFYLPDFGGPKVVTIHDLSVISYPEYHPIERINMLSGEIKKSIDAANAIITDSEYVKKEIMTMFGADSNKIHVVPLSHGYEYFPRGPDVAENIMNKYDIKWKKYVLLVGTIEPRKNIEAAIDAFSQLSDAIKANYKLIIVGHKGWSNQGIFQKIENATAEGWLRYIGFVEEQDLPCIYSGAQLFVFPSFYEGFGLPVLEAMASGVPVVASNSSSIPEVCGTAAALCDPNDTSGLRDLILRGIQDEEWRREAIKRGLERTTHFSWDKCARETYEIYKRYAN
tara:strand:- start:9803 stop:10915 length:1113 start_codon:yes stop_codon:yes gene_type:complete